MPDSPTKTGAEEQLRIAEARLRAIVQNTPDVAIQEFDQSGAVLFWNHASERIYGWPATEALGKTLGKLIFTGKEEARFNTLLKQISETGKSVGPVEFHFSTRDGKEGWCLSTVFQIPAHQGERRFICMDVDITERKTAENALQASGEKYSKVFRNSPDAISITRISDGRIIETNDGFRRVFGYSPDEVVGRTSLELKLWKNPDDRERVLEEVRRNGFVRGWEVSFRDREGKYGVALFSAEEFEINKEPCLVTVVHDITERKRSEQALRDSEDRFRNLTQAGFEGIAISENGQILDVNEQCLAMFRCERDQIVGRSVVEFVHPESREIVAEAIHTGKESIYEHRLLRKDGSWFHAEARAKVVHVGSRILRMTALRDITERKQAEEALRASEESLRATIENTPYVAVQWYDASGRIKFWNTASELMFGWKASEAIGKTLDQLIHTPEEAAAFCQVLVEIERTGKAVGPVEYPFRRRDGSEGTCLSTTFQIPLATGGSCFVCMDVDLTERKAAEASLRQAQEQALAAHVDFTQRLIFTEEQQRKRLANELHDSLGQNLSLIKNRVHLMLEQPGLSAALKNQVEAIDKTVTDAIEEVRNLAHNLRPIHIDQFGLTDSIQTLIEKVAQSSTIQFERRLDNVDDCLNGEEATIVYRIIQEALNNLIKHSKAARANIVLERDLHCVRIRVEDDGQGFDPAIVASAKGRTGIGLNSINERVRMLDGSVVFKSAPGAGTRISIEIPVPEHVGDLH